ncbi:hypothetical protein C2S51_009654 [Perilla frutescens var. frutescens]|nr:hypothetical protein C2S51_009654 [Perilla frutescens var. frutescens]
MKGEERGLSLRALPSASFEHARETVGKREKCARYSCTPSARTTRVGAVVIDMWSVGCIMAELLLGQVAFPGNSELEQLCCIGRRRGFLGERLKALLSASGFYLIQKLLVGDPDQRITADDALHHAWFREFYGFLSD